MSLSHAPVTGLFAAVVTPTQEDGQVDLDTFDRIIAFLLEAGVSGICIGGATGEYPHFETSDRTILIERAARRVASGSALLVGIGGPSIHQVLQLGCVSMDAGARAVLLPMPMFFRYDQQDLEAFCLDVSGALRAPCLLYNLPAFTNALTPETALHLLETAEFITGIKDSSGENTSLATFAEARAGRPWSLLVGDDRLLHAGLAAGWDGGISGIAGFCPELIVALHRSFVEGRRDEAARLQALLDDLIEHLAPFPTPWGIRIGLAARGLDTGPLPLPITAMRQQQIAAFTRWLPEWLQSTGIRHARTLARR
jgi:4-hydroxy-tetrahydrodipicolinate synthase